MAEGLDNFQNYQVLEYALSFVIPYKDTNPLAHELISKFGSLDAVLEANVQDLMEVKGMGEASACFLNSITKIYSFYEKEKVNRTGTIVSPQSAFDYAKGFFKGKRNEEVYMISLLPNNKILKTEKLAEGDVDNIKVGIRKITDNIARNKVNNIILVHNHPNGIASPSEEDDKFTKALVASLALNECFILDHVIVAGEDKYYSYRQSGKLDLYKQSVAHLLVGKEPMVAQPMAKYGESNDKKWQWICLH